VEVAGNRFKIPDFSSKKPASRIYIAKAERFSVRVRPEKIEAPVSITGLRLDPAPEGPAIVQQGTTITLPARSAITHSVMLRYEPATNKNCLGYWVNPADTAEWNFHVNEPGDYEIELWQGCGKGQGGSDILVEIHDNAGIIQEARFTVEDTGHFQNFIPRKLGKVHFADTGNYSFWVKPQRKQAGAIMDIHRVLLTRLGK
jgi:hypothetical protein